MKSLFGFLGALIAALIVAVMTVGPPQAEPDTAPADAFSAERAMVDVSRIGQVPHPTGSRANAHVRSDLILRLRELGLEVSTQRADAVHNRWPGVVMGGSVENLIGVLPGEDRSAPAVVLMSHYDSAVGSPGAGDDAAGVAASLEAVRALIASGAPRRRDLIVLITDGEEQGLLGANAFFSQHALRARVGAVVNLETRGHAGRAFMFETGRMNGAMMGLYARAVRRPSTTSLAAFLYSILPNDTDFSHPRDLGVAGFNIAFIGEPFHYHSATAIPANLNEGSVQDLGNQTLDLTRALLVAEALPEPRPNAVFSDIFGRFTLVYPAWLGWVVVLVSGLVLAGLAWRSDPRRQAWRVAAVGAAGGVCLLIAAGAFGHGLFLLTGASSDFVMGRPLLGRLDQFEWAMIAAGLAAALLISRLMLRGRPTLYRPHEAPALGLLLFGWLAGLGLQIAAPEAAIIAQWPTLIGALALLAARRLGVWAWPVATLLGIAGAGWMFGLLHGVFLGVGATVPAAPAALTALALLPLAVMLAAAARTRAALIAGVAALLIAAAIGLWLRIAPQGTPQRPLPTQILYVADIATGTAQLAAPADMQDGWTLTALRSQGGRIRQGQIPALGSSDWRLARAAPVETEAPVFSFTPLEDGRLQLTATAPGARELRLTFESAQGVDGLSIADQRIASTSAGTPLRIRWADPGRGVSIVLPDDPGLTLHWAAFHDGWPEEARPLPRRSADVMPFGPSDSLVVVGELGLRPPG